MEKPNRLPFSLPAFLLAPWPVPLTWSALLAFGNPSDLGSHGVRGAIAFFLLCLAVALVISYLGTAALVVCFHFVAQARPVTRLVSAGCGVLLAALGYLPFVYISWGGSGPDSGPPLESFPVYFLRNWQDPILGLFLLSGLIAAVLYDTLARLRAAKKPATA